MAERNSAYDFRSDCSLSRTCVLLRESTAESCQGTKKVREFVRGCVTGAWKSPCKEGFRTGQVRVASRRTAKLQPQQDVTPRRRNGANGRLQG